MDNTGKQHSDPFFRAVQAQVREARGRHGLKVSMVPCRENRNAGAWRFSTSHVFTWETASVTLTSFGDDAWGYLLCRNLAGQPTGAYRLARADWPSVVAIVIEMFDHCWYSVRPYGTAATIVYHQAWGRWTVLGDRCRIPLMPSILLASDAAPRPPVAKSPVPPPECG